VCNTDYIRATLKILFMSPRIKPFFLSVVIIIFPAPGFTQKAMEVKRFKVNTAQQGVAVDRDHFYVINNSSITKHRKENGHEVAHWDGVAEGIKHLNSGTIIRGKLYCANSNFPIQRQALSKSLIRQPSSMSARIALASETDQ
jgi:hypothetical protein